MPGEMKPRFGVAPAGECFDADDGPGFATHDRLVGHIEFVIGDGGLQVGFDGAALFHLFGHVGAEENGAVAAGVLGLVEGDVGVAHDFIHGASVLWRDRDADGRGDRHRLAFDLDGLKQRTCDTACEQLRGIGICRPPEDREFVAAVAGDKVAGADVHAQAFGHFLDQGIASRVAERVVDLLEPIDIEIGDDRGLAHAVGIDAGEHHA